MCVGGYVGMMCVGGYVGMMCVGGYVGRWDSDVCRWVT